MTGRDTRSPGSWLDLGLVVSLALLCAWLHWALHPYAFDDAYIHFRVAEQFLEHGAPYYNVGQAVMASSSAAWTLLLTLLFRFTAPSPAWVAALNWLVLTAGTVVFCDLAYELRGDRLGRGLCWLFALPYLALVHVSAVGLMETPLAMLVLGTALWLQARERPEAFALFSVAMFVRPELAVFLMLFTGAYLWLDRRALGRRIAWAAVAAVPFVAYELYYFGTLIPHSVRAKTVVYSLSHTKAVQILMQQLLGFEPLLKETPALVVVGVAFLLLAVLCIFAERGKGDLERPEDRLLYLVGGGGGLIALAYVAAKGLVFPWYLPLFMVPLVFALFLIAAGSRSAPVKALLLLVVLVPSVWALTGSVTAAGGRYERFQYIKRNALTRQYLAIGERLRREFPGARVMTSEVGGLGYAFGGEVLDGAGLLTPEALEHHPMQVPDQRSAGFIGSIPAALVEELQPEVVVGIDIFVRDLWNTKIIEKYRLDRVPIYTDEDRDRVQSESVWWSRNLNVFTRRDLSDSDDR